MSKNINSFWKTKAIVLTHSKFQGKLSKECKDKPIIVKKNLGTVQKTEMFSKEVPPVKKQKGSSFLSPEDKPIGHKRTKSLNFVSSSKPGQQIFHQIPMKSNSVKVTAREKTPERHKDASTFENKSGRKKDRDNNNNNNAKDKDKDYTLYPTLSHNEITDPSQQRMKDYSVTLGMISTCMTEIKDCLKECNSVKKENISNIKSAARQINPEMAIQSSVIATSQVGNKRRGYSLNEKEISQMKLCIIEESTNECEGEDRCDFSDFSMLENALVVPPKISRLNYLDVKDILRSRSKKFSMRPDSTQSDTETNMVTSTNNPAIVIESRPCDRIIVEDDVEYIEDESQSTVIQEDYEKTLREKLDLDITLNREVNKVVKRTSNKTESDKVSRSTNYTTLANGGNVPASRKSQCILF